MPGPSDYERSQVEAVLSRPTGGEVRVERGLALLLLPFGQADDRVQRIVIDPALRRNGLNVLGLRVVFDDETPLPIIADWLGRAEVVIADVSELNASVLYLLGLCHGLRRCPLLLARDSIELPFDLDALRCLRYRADDPASLYDLREDLSRTLRIFLAASRRRQDGGRADENVA
jgi:hypothetical protein